MSVVVFGIILYACKTLAISAELSATDERIAMYILYNQHNLDIDNFY